MYKRKSKKAVTAVVATALILVVAVVSVIGFQSWFGSFSSEIFVNVEQNSNQANSNSQIETLVGNQLYFKNNLEDNLSIKEIKVNGNICNISITNVSLGVGSISLQNCTDNLTTNVADIAIVTENKIFHKKVFLKDVEIVNSYNNELNCVNITKNLFGLWHFDKTLNEFFVDSSGNNNDIYYVDNDLSLFVDFDNININTLIDESLNNKNVGTLNNNPICNQDGIKGKSCQFDGNNNYVTTILKPRQEEITIATWIKPYSIPDDTKIHYGIVSNYNTVDGSHFGLRLYNSSKISFFADDDINAIWDTNENTFNIIPNNWYFVVGKFKQNDYMKIYINGNLILNRTGINVGTVNSNSNFYIGRDLSNSDNHYFHGEIDEVAIYNRTLTDEEISYLYSNNTSKLIKYNSNGVVFDGLNDWGYLNNSFDWSKNYTIMTKFQIAKSAVQLHAEENKFQHFALWGDYYNSSDRIYNFISWSGDNLSLFGKSTLQSSSCDINPNSFGCLYTPSPILINTNYLSTIILNPTSSISKLYKNQDLVDENNYEVPLNINKFYVGTKIEGYNKKKDEGHFFNGTISELIIFEDILTQAEIQQIYQGDVQGKTICIS